MYVLVCVYLYTYCSENWLDANYVPTVSSPTDENAMDMDRPYFDGDDFIPIGLDRIEENASPGTIKL